jgi:hypothetical protein
MVDPLADIGYGHGEYPVCVKVILVTPGGPAVPEAP